MVKRAESREGLTRPTYAPPSLPRTQPPSLIGYGKVEPVNLNESTQANLGSGGKNYREKYWSDNNLKNADQPSRPNMPPSKQFEASKNSNGEGWLKDKKEDDSSMAYTPFKQPSPSSRAKVVHDDLRQDYRPKCEESEAFEKDFVAAGSVVVQNSRPTSSVPLHQARHCNDQNHMERPIDQSHEHRQYLERGVPIAMGRAAVHGGAMRNVGGPAYVARRSSEGVPVQPQRPPPANGVWSVSNPPMRDSYHEHDIAYPQYASDQFIHRQRVPQECMEGGRVRASYAPMYGAGGYGQVPNERQVPINHVQQGVDLLSYTHEAPPPYAGGFQKLLAGVETMERQENRPTSKVTVAANGQVVVKHPYGGEFIDCPPEKYQQAMRVMSEPPTIKRKFNAAPVFTLGLLKWQAVERLCLLQILIGLVIVGLGIARLVLMTVWGLGIEVVFGTVVCLTGIVGVAGVRKRQYCCLVACFVMSALNTLLALPPLVSGLMVTVPYTFPDVDRKHFIGKSEPPGISILLSVVCLIEILLAVITASMGCSTAGKVLALTDEDRGAIEENEQYAAELENDDYIADDYREE